MPRKLVLFVHGLGSSSDTAWGMFPEFVRTAPELEDHFDVDYYDYPSSKFRLPFTRRLPSILDLAEGLRTIVRNCHSEREHITLLCHSMGGLVARAYLLGQVKRNEATPVTGALLYAVPNNGADLARLGARFNWRNHALRQMCCRSELSSYAEHRLGNDGSSESVPLSLRSCITR